MKKEKSKGLLIAKAFTAYFSERAKRVLALTKKDYESYHIDIYSRSSNLEVWFFNKEEIVGKVRMSFDGRQLHKKDYRDGK